MMSSLYVSATGMKTLGEGMSVISHNLANQNTVGFQRAMMLYEDLMSTSVPSSSNAITNMSQAGKGVATQTIRTMFGNGGYESSNESTDMSITGLGFFPVTRDGETLYTRAGNFRFTKDGYLNDPTDYTLLGCKITDGVTATTSEPIRLDLNSPENNTNIIPPRATGLASLILNLGSTDDKTTDATDPFFSLAKTWNGNATPPLAANSYNFSNSIKVYDSEGKQQQLNVYFDYAGEVDGRKVYEYVVGINPDADAREGYAGTEAAGMLMSGTMTFDVSGKFVDMTGFSPSDPATFADLGTWKPTGFDANGNPAVNVSFIPSGGGTPTANQQIGLDFGIKLEGTWKSGFASAGAIGTGTDWIGEATQRALPSKTSTAYNGTSTLTASQDGFTTGYLNSINLTEDGYLVGKYSNGQNVDLYRIQLAHFTSQDNLKREGGNHFSAGTDTGVTELGFPGDENYGKVAGNSLETSNVDMTTEFVDMIRTQRGFQMNSKVLSTSDQMIQKAVELKR